jgi:stage V sporulation protein SpoVS
MITLTQDCLGVPDQELGAKIKQPMIAMAKAQAEQDGLTLVSDPVWESFRDEEGKRYAIKLTWETR